MVPRWARLQGRTSLRLAELLVQHVGGGSLEGLALALALLAGSEKLAAHLAHAVLALHALDLLVLSPGSGQGDTDEHGRGADDVEGSGAVVPGVGGDANAVVEAGAEPAACGGRDYVLESVETLGKRLI